MNITWFTSGKGKKWQNDYCYCELQVTRFCYNLLYTYSCPLGLQLIYMHHYQPKLLPFCVSAVWSVDNLAWVYKLYKSSGYSLIFWFYYWTITSKIASADFTVLDQWYIDSTLTVDLAQVSPVSAWRLLVGLKDKKSPTSLHIRQP